jgi:O-succinylbenzoate synthase
MSVANLLEEAEFFGFPLRNRFRDTESRFGILLNGPSGWSEFAPFDDYSDEVAGRWLAAALEQSHGSWPSAIRTEIPINGILPIVDVATTKSLTKEILSRGMTTIKIKVNDGSAASLEHDIERIAAVREVVPADTKIRIDVNGAWTVNEAVTALKEIISATGELDYVEQPCRTLQELAKLRTQVNSGIRIAVDESIRLAESIKAAEIRSIADVVIVKSIPLGGVNAALKIVEEIGLPAVVSGSLDTSVGLASGLQLAGCIENLYGACGLGTGLLLGGDVVKHSLLPVNGYIPVGRVKPDEDCLARWYTCSNQIFEWSERLVRAWYASGIHLVSDEVRKAVENG